MTSLQVACALFRRMIFGSPRLRLASAAGPLVDDYELDCLPPSTASQHWQPNRTRILTTTTSTTEFLHNTNWKGQVMVPQHGQNQYLSTTNTHVHDILVSRPGLPTVEGHQESPSEQIESMISPSLRYKEEETYIFDRVGGVPIWADTVNHRPGL